MRKALTALALSGAAYPMQVNLFANQNGNIQKVYISPHWKIIETLEKEKNDNTARIKITSEGRFIKILTQDKKVKQLIAVLENGNFIFSKRGKLVLPKTFRKIILYLVDEKGNISLPITINLQS